MKIANNVPGFSSAELIPRSFELYSDLDALGRCGACYASIGVDLMPTGERGSIGMIKPSGWQIDKYEFVDGKYLFNRCHLIAFSLTGETDNEKNLITGTRYMNAQGMIPYETRVHDYVIATGNHVLYRATPMYSGNDLVARGVHIEAESVEDKGKGLSFNVFVYNVQPGVVIDYATGASREDGTIKSPETTAVVPPASYSYVLNKNSKKIHLPTCASVKDIAQKNIVYSDKTLSVLHADGYADCQQCHPSLLATGETTQKSISTTATPPVTSAPPLSYQYVLNKNSKKIHLPTCSSVKDIAVKNRVDTDKSLSTLYAEGYSDCKRCNPSLH